MSAGEGPSGPSPVLGDVGHTGGMRAAALTLLLFTCAAASASATVAERPTLRLAGTAPLVVQGKAFHANEKVQVLISAGKPLRASVRTGLLGNFRLAFRYRVPSCTAISVQAFGNRGSRATFVLDVPDCAPIPG